MGYWENTIYVNHGSVEDVVAALDSIFAKEGMARIDTPQPRDRLAVEPMQYDAALHNDLWGLAVFSGAPSWTVIKTAPLELLGERAAASVQMRLADLCRQLSASALQLNVYDSTGLILAEVSTSGEVFVSGCNFQSRDPFVWNGVELSEELFEARFQLHSCQHLLAEDMCGDDVADALAKELGAHNAAYCDNLVSVDTLISHKPFTASGGMAVYYQWTGESRLRFSPCDSWEEYRAQRADKS